jgi:hypothetical protein
MKMSGLRMVVEAVVLSLCVLLVFVFVNVIR